MCQQSEQLKLKLIEEKIGEGRDVDGNHWSRRKDLYHDDNLLIRAAYSWEFTSLNRATHLAPGEEGAEGFPSDHRNFHQWRSDRRRASG